jgi:hypothetical protein
VNYQLTLQGIAPVKGLYLITFAPISMVDELRKWTMEKIKAEVAKTYRVDMNLLSDSFILKTFLGLSDEEIEAVLREKPEPISQPSGKGALGTTGVRASGATGFMTPRVGAMGMTSQKGDGNGLHIGMMHLMNEIETLRDLVDLELSGNGIV